VQAHFNIGNAEGFKDIAIVHPAGIVPREARRFVEIDSARAVRKVTLQVRVPARGSWCKASKSYMSYAMSRACWGCLPAFSASVLSTGCSKSQPTC
jgi:hypothetical protein